MFGEERVMKIVDELNQQIQQELNDYNNDYRPLILAFVLYCNPNKWDNDKYNYETFCKVSKIIRSNKELRRIFMIRSGEHNDF